MEPDYLLIHKSVQQPFVEAFRAALKEFFPTGDYANMPTIIAEKHYRRLLGLLENQNIVLGGGHDDARRFIEPTLLADVSPDSPVMQEEIFGPILPMLPYETLEEVVSFVRARPRPLAFYIFTASKETERKLLDSCSSAAAASTIPSSTSPPRTCPSAAWAIPAWAATTAKRASIPSPTSAAS